jgi:hypothetical protein
LNQETRFIIIFPIYNKPWQQHFAFKTSFRGPKTISTEFSASKGDFAKKSNKASNKRDKKVDVAWQQTH